MSLSIAESLAALPAAERRAALRGISQAGMRSIEHDWAFWGRPSQQMPAGDWFVWLILAGRGFGKTRTATENIARMLRGPTPLTAPEGAPALMSIIADTPFDMRQYSIEGPSGFLSVGPPDCRPYYSPANKTLLWPNGCKALLFSAEDPETLRGASGSFFWWDELAKSGNTKKDETARDKAEVGWSNLMFGMREGRPRGIVTTTPRPTPTLKKLVASPSTYVTRGSTFENRSNLSPEFYREVVEPLVGTRLGRQEIEAEILEDVPGALWQRDVLERNRIPAPRDEDERRALLARMRRVVVAMDPAATSGEGANEMGIVVAGLRDDGHGCVLADLTVRGTPDEASRRAIRAYDDWEADCVVGEVNNGGEWIGQTIRLTAKAMQLEGARASSMVNYKSVHASRGKRTRAEPVSGLDEQGRVHHVGAFPKLEDQLCEWDPNAGQASPDRLDARVWAITELMISPAGRGRVGVVGPKILSA